MPVKILCNLRPRVAHMEGLLGPQTIVPLDYLFLLLFSSVNRQKPTDFSITPLLPLWRKAYAFFPLCIICNPGIQSISQSYVPSHELPLQHGSVDQL